MKSRTKTPPTRWWDIPAACLLLAALIVAASRLVATEWTNHLSMAHTLTFLGMLAGFALGQSIFSPRTSVIFGSAYGLFAILWQLGITLEGNVLWSDRLLVLGGRLLNGIGQLLRREAVTDPIFFLVCMTCLSWALAAHAAYTLTRHAHPWRAVLPTGLAMLIIHAANPYADSGPWYLAVYFFFSLVLLARLNYLHRATYWRQTRIQVPDTMVQDLAHIILLASISLILIAWIAPAPADALNAVGETWRRVTHSWRSAARERLSDAFASLRAVEEIVVIDYYGEKLSLGQGTELSEALILAVQTPPGERNNRYYWRARVYDHYTGGQWNNVAFSSTQTIPATGIGLALPELEGRKVLTLTFTPAIPIATLYTAPQPQWVDRPVRATLAHTPGGDGDLAALHAVDPLLSGETYQARSALSDVTIAQLRAAGDDYPAWVSGRYLQLDPTITPRTRELAREIAAGLDTPYDVVAAVTRYLRTRITYDETVPPLPTDQEILDWFLFDLQRGSCNYYASAEILMLRSLGIPARLAVGFSQGERQAQSNTYMVRQYDAHAWPEVYFPGLGWIEFEPTASEAPLNRPSGESSPGGVPDPSLFDEAQDDALEERLAELLAQADDPPYATAPTARADLETIAIMGASILILGLAVFAWQRNRRRGKLAPLPVLLEAGLRRINLQAPTILRNWTRHATRPPLLRAYQELNHALVRLGAPPHPADTPSERALALGDLLPTAAAPAQRLLAEYHATAYSSLPGDLQIAQRAGRDVRTLSWQAAIRQLRSRK